MTFVFLVVAVGNAAQNLSEQVRCKEDTKPIKLSLPKVAQRSSIYASDGTLMATLYLENRKVVRLDKVAPITRKAVLAIEDYQFYQHGGVDLKAILRAALADIRAGHITQGGSTISQQLVKVITNRRADTLSRKLCEAEEAMSLEHRYTKNHILEMYLNEIYLGHGAYGLEAAAETYFGKHAGQLDLPQSALLAAMIANPSLYDPIANPTGTVDRRNLVLARMAQIGWVPGAEAQQAQATPIKLAKAVKHPKQRRQPLFVQFVRKMIEQDQDHQFDALGRTQAARDRAMFQGGLAIHTTIDPAWQDFAIHAVRNRLPQKTDPQAAVATVEPGTGAVRVLVSGRDFGKHQKDLVWQAQHQEGSAFKPFTLVAAFREGIPPGQVYSSRSPVDLRADCNGWMPFNAEGGGDLGYMDLYKATALSINVVFAQLARDVGPPNIGRAAEDMGIHLSHPVGPADCSVTLGTFETSPLDMATAYATLAAGGKYCPYYGVERIVGPGPRHRVIYQHNPSATCRQAIAPDIAYQVTDMLKGVLQYGTGAARAPIDDRRPEAGKTGTGENFTNAWFCGYVPQLATAVWIGYPGNPRPMLGVEGYSEMFGGDIPALIWHDVMSRFTNGLPPKDFPPPPPQKTGTIPSVIGQTESEALKTLADANFSGVADSQIPSLLPVGTVAGQSPGGGATAVLGSLVHLAISNGKPPEVQVPNVIGQTKADATAALQGAGFTVSTTTVDVSDPKEDGIVVDQSPPPGNKAKQGSTVTIVVGRFRKPGPSPTPAPTPTITPTPTISPPGKHHGHGPKHH
jgi:penicillin-binding protein 1A